MKMQQMYCVSPSTYHVTKLIHLQGVGDEAAVKLFVVAVDELLVLFVHRHAVRFLFGGQVLLLEV